MTPASKTQKRLMKLFGLPISGDYAVNAATLADANLPSDAMPRGATWRDCAKMTDADFARGCGARMPDHIEALTGRAEMAEELR